MTGGKSFEASTAFIPRRGRTTFFPDDFPRFSTGEQKFVAALNQLLHEELILVIEGGEVPPESGGGQRLAVCLNPDRVTEVRKELLVWYRDPRFIIPAVIGLAGVVWAVASVFLPDNAAD